MRGHSPSREAAAEPSEREAQPQAGCPQSQRLVSGGARGQRYPLARGPSEQIGVSGPEQGGGLTGPGTTHTPQNYNNRVRPKDVGPEHLVSWGSIRGLGLGRSPSRAGAREALLVSPGGCGSELQSSL